MRHILLTILSIMLLAAPAWANPFIVCYPQAGVTHYRVTGAAWVVSPVTAQADGSIEMDIVSATVGSSNLSFAACKDDPVWGEQCSSTAPFGFTRPAAPAMPTLVKLVP